MSVLSTRPPTAVRRAPEEVRPRFRVAAAVLLCLIAGAQAAADSPFVLRPYLIATGPTDMSVLWTATVATNFTLRWSAGAAAPRAQACAPLATGIVYTVRQPSAPEDAPPAVTNREFRYCAPLKELAPDTEYRYEVAGAGTVATGRFVTLAAPGRDFTFAVVGDSQSPEIWGLLAERLQALQPRLLMHTGDLVNDGNYPPNMRHEFFEPGAGLLGGRPIMPAVGNHDSSHWLRRFFPYPPGLAYYSFDCGDVHFVCLNTFVGGDGRARMLQWLDDDLAASRARWKIVYSHIPSYDVGKHGASAGRGDVLPILRRHRVDLVCAGHSHCYERFRPMYTEGENEAHPITFIVNGGASLPHALAQDPYLAAGHARSHFLAVTVNRERLALRCIDLDGEELDALTLTKNAAGELDPAYVAAAVPESGFGALRAIVRPSMKSVTLLDDPLLGPARLRLSLGAGDKAMKYTVRPERRAAAICELTPATGAAAAGQTAEIELTLKLRDPGAHKTLPILRVECVFEIDGEKISVFSGLLQYRPPAALAPAA